MRRFLAVLVAALMWAGSAFAYDFLSFPNFPQRGQGSFEKPPWWYNGHLTFYAPFDNPADPLRLIKGTGSLSFTRATTATYVHPTTGLITTAASGQLRIEANGALIEGQRTNVSLYSDTLAGTTPGGSAEVWLDNTVSPDGTQNADRIAGLDGTTAYLVTWPSGVNPATKIYTGSLWMRGNGTITIRLTNGVDQAQDHVFATTASWDRYSFTTAAYNATAGNLTMQFLSLGGETATWLDVYGFQIEEGSSMSSYIPTVGSAVTRNADVLTFPASGNILDNTGTIYFEVDLSEIDDAHGWVSGANHRPIYSQSGNFIYFDGTNNTTWQTSIVSANSSSKWAVVYGGESTEAYKDGVVLTTVGVFDGSWDFGNYIRVGHDAAEHYLFGHIKNIRVWNRALSDTDLQAITR